MLVIIVFFCRGPQGKRHLESRGKCRTPGSQRTCLRLLCALRPESTAALSFILTPEDKACKERYVANNLLPTSVIARSTATRQSEQNPTAPPSQSFFATLRICSPQNFCEQLAVFLFLYFLAQESTKEPLHGENGGIRLRSFAERARKTYAVPNTRSGRSLPRRTNPRHFHECGTKIQVPPHTKTHRHSELLPVILWSLLPFVILRKGSALTKNLFPRKIDS